MKEYYFPKVTNDRYLHWQPNWVDGPCHMIVQSHKVIDNHHNKGPHAGFMHSSSWDGLRFGEHKVRDDPYCPYKIFSSRSIRR